MERAPRRHPRETPNERVPHPVGGSTPIATRATSQAAWLVRIDRAEHLQLVPAENVELVERHREALARVFPAEYAANPLDSLADPLEEWGTPFEELPASGRDDELSWDPAEAIISHDALQPVATEPADLRR